MKYAAALYLLLFSVLWFGIGAYVMFFDPEGLDGFVDMITMLFLFVLPSLAGVYVVLANDLHRKSTYDEDPGEPMGSLPTPTDEDYVESGSVVSEEKA